jgi:Glycosyl hydrolase catalytic core
MRLGATGTISSRNIHSNGTLGSRFPAISLSILLLSCWFGTACDGGSNSSSQIITSPPPPPPAGCTSGPNAAPLRSATALRPRAQSPSTSGAIPATYFGLNLHPGVFTSPPKYPWPAFPFGAVRLWATETTWNDINTSAGNYDFTTLDSTIAAAQSNGQSDFIFTFGAVPTWASSKPGDTSCTAANNGSCDPPQGLNSDGSGDDSLWQNFVTAITAHNAANGYPIHYWEIWNEPNILVEWNGTPAQMARMAMDAYNIIKAAGDPIGAKVTTPTPGDDGTGQNITSWEPAYLAALVPLGGIFADIITYHGYTDACNSQVPESSENSDLSDLTLAISQSGLSASLASLPIWNTEGSWNKDAGLPDPNMQAAYLARLYLLQWSLGISRFYWFQYGNTQNGTLLNSDNSLDLAGTAYGQVYGWMVGATLTSPCTANGTVWTCGFTSSGGVQEQAVWDTSQSCSNGSCTTSPHTPSSTYTEYYDLAGDPPTAISGTVQVGAEPILLTNGNLPSARPPSLRR